MPNDFNLEQEADKMAKSLESMANLAPKEEEIEKSAPETEDEAFNSLLKSVRALGKEGLKKIIPTLSKGQKTLLSEVLEKAVSLDRAARKNTDHGGTSAPPQKAREPKSEMKANDKDGVDSWDEEFMQEDNAQQRHQGGDGQPKPGEWQGQIIKAESEKISERSARAKTNISGGSQAEAAQSKKLEKKQGVPKGVDPAKHERCVKDVKKQGHDKSSSYAICNASMKKGDEDSEENKMEKANNLMFKQMVSRMKERGMDRDKCMEALSKKGYDMQKAEKYWSGESKKDNSDEVKASGKAVEQKADKKKPAQKKNMKKAEETPAEDKKLEKSEQKEEDIKEEKVEKSVVWRDHQSKLLGATTRRGQNCHYNVSDDIIAQDQKLTEFKKSGELYYGDNAKVEKLEKSDKPVTSVNDMLEQGMDMDQSRFNLAKANTKSKPNGAYTHKTFDDADMAKAMGLSEEEAAEVLGKQKAPQE